MMNRFIRMLRSWSLGLLAISFVQFVSIAKEPSLQTPAGQSRSVLLPVDEVYRIGSGDVIDIQIDKAPELSRTFQVGPDGTVNMFYVGRVMASDKTADELGTFIANQLRGRYLRDPQVTVTIQQYGSRSIFIQGSVRNPGMFQVAGRPSLLKLISLAGGLTSDHGSTAFVIREIKKPALAESKAPNQAIKTSTPVEVPTSEPETEVEAKYELLKVQISGLFLGDFTQDALVEPGDIINIPPTDVFFVAGEVEKPGSFQLKEGTTLRQAISLAEGTTFKAATSRVIIFRDDLKTGKRLEIQVDLGKVMKGKSDDVLIMANDTITVPDSRLKAVGGVLLNALGVSAIRIPGRRRW